MKPILESKNLSKKYQIKSNINPYLTISDSLKAVFKNRKNQNEDFWALNDISFDIYPGDSIAILGKNGAGKSTLLKVLSRITPPTKGSFIQRGRLASLLEVGTGFHAELTGRENVYLNGSILGLKRHEISAKFDEIVEFSGVEKFIETPLKHYSSGMQLRLAFAVAAHLEPEILIIDEVLAVGDIQFQKKCLEKMSDVANTGISLLFVSHNLSAVTKICKKALYIDKGTSTGICTLESAINQYNDSIINDKIEYDKGPVKSVSIKLNNNKYIEISIEYKTDFDILMPCLGVLIADYLGNPICSANPLVDGFSNFPPPKKEGIAKLILSSPTLANGRYRLSAWLGDGMKNIYRGVDCLSFEVVTSLSFDAALDGPVIPTTEWLFE
jgi:lipopolysaccharide transport system ATP-binding protein